MLVLTIVILYFVVLIEVGVYFSKRIKVASDFLVAGRKIGLLLTTATLAAVQLGAGVLLGGGELGASSGVWPGMWYGIGCGGGLILAGLLVAAKLRKQGGYVPLDYFAFRYGDRKWVRFWGWFSNIPSLLGIFVAQIMAAGSIFTIFGLNYKEGVLLSGLVIVIYSVLSGMWGVIVNDFIQLTIIMIGIPTLAIAAFIKIGQMESVSFHHLINTPFIPSGMFSKAVFIILPFFFAISISYDAFMRYQSAKSAKVAQWGCIISGVLVIFISFCAGFVGAAGRLILTDVQHSEVFPQLIQALLPPLLSGIVIAALLAATMSSANCLLISLSGCFSRDLYNKVFHPNVALDDLKYVKVISRAVVVTALIFGVSIAFYARGILKTIIIFNYPYMGSMLVPLLGGVLWKRATPRGALAALLTGGIIAGCAFLSAISGVSIGWLNVDLGLFVAYGFSTLVLIVVSLSSKKEIDR